jgi:hypothetical protein
VSGYTVDLGALQVTADGIQAVLDELGQLGINGEQESGSPIENAALSSDDMGSPVLAALVGDALQRAHYALRAMLHNGAQMVSMLRQIQAGYEQTEHQVASLFTQISHDLSTTPPPVPQTTPGPVADRLSGGGR